MDIGIVGDPMHIKATLVAIVSVGGKNTCDHGSMTESVVAALVAAAIVRPHQSHFIAQPVSKLQMLCIDSRVNNTQANP